MEAVNRLLRCLLDQTDEESRRARRLRRRTLLIAILLQAAVLTLLVLRPLLGAPAGEWMLARMVPLPPWKGQPAAAGAREPERPRPPTHDRHNQPHPLQPGVFTFRPPDRPAEHLETEAAPEIGTANHIPDGPGFGDPNGLIPNPGFLRGDGRPAPPLPPPPPETESPPRKPRFVASEVQEAKLVTRVEPVYPILAKQIRLEGTVLIRAIIAKDGTVESAEILRGHPWLAKAALDAIVRWQYHPTLLNGQPVEVETLITVIFKLQ